MAPFITRNPPVAFRFTPFIPSPLCRIGEYLTISIRQATHNHEVSRAPSAEPWRVTCAARCWYGRRQRVSSLPLVGGW